MLLSGSKDPLKPGGAGVLVSIPLPGLRMPGKIPLRLSGSKVFRELAGAGVLVSIPLLGLSMLGHEGVPSHCDVLSFGPMLVTLESAPVCSFEQPSQAPFKTSFTA